MYHKITVFQTRDPYVARYRRDFQFVASAELTLETYGQLHSEPVCEALGKPGELFWIIGYSALYSLTGPLPVRFLLDRRIIRPDDEYGLVLIVCAHEDNVHARQRCKDRLRAEEHAELMARLQRVPVIRAWNYVTSRISRAFSRHSNLKPQSRLSQMKHLLSCWWRRRVGDYGYLEVTDVTIEKGKEYRAPAELQDSDVKAIK